ncbi:Ca(2+)-dependent cysteine protease [Podila verticillata]|nr:Ca(2+)-dependent cysteine protease [Podila verticillata]
MSQEQGEPVIHEEKYTTVLPDGRKVTKTRITKTFTHQVQVPAGTTLPPGAHLISSTTVEGLAPTIGNGQATYHYQETSSSSGYNGDGHSNNGSTGQHSAQYSAENGAEEQQQYNQFNQINNTINSQHGGGVVKTEPTVVVESTVDDNGRKVTKTTTTTSSSSSSGKPNSFSKFFKRFSLNSGKSDANLKPLPSIPVNSKPVDNKPTVHHTTTVQVTQAPVAPSPEPEDSYEPPEEVKKIHIQTLEVKKADGSKLHLSDCTGERRALLIGINYTGLANPLHGCVNDTADMKRFLLSVGFEEENIRVLTDDQVGTERMPTRDNIFHHLKWLIQDAKKNDSYFLHYSGHGGQVRDLDGDETDGLDNCIFPVDHAENGVIIDDELHRDVVKKLPPGVRLTVVFDCCHSGSALDLPYIYAATGYIRGSSALANLGHELVEGNFDADALKALQDKWQKLQLEEKEFARQVSLKAADADVIMFSGCKDDQTSADVSITRGGNTSSNGAMTYAFTKCIRENPVQSYQEMLGNIRDLLKDKYKQKPQLSSSRPMNMQELFHM